MVTSYDRLNNITTTTTPSLREKLGMPPDDELITKLRTGKTEEEIALDKLGLERENENLTSAAFERQEIEDACRTELDMLAALAMPGAFKYLFPATHITAWRLLLESVTNEAGPQFPQIALGIPRGHAKTTLIKLFILWCVLFSKKKFFLITASTLQHAINIVSDVMDMLREQNIKAVFGDYSLGSEIDNKELQKFGFRGRTIAIVAIGAQGSVRGLNVNNERPDVMVFDDIQTKECAESQTQSKTLEEWMVGTAMKAKNPSGCIFIFAGNMFPTQYSILRKLKSNASWTKFISGAVLADGTALWPELRSMESLIEELNNDIAMGQAPIFFSEVLNDIEAGRNSEVDYSKFPEWPWLEEDIPQGKFIIVDPGTGKKHGDADVFMLVEVYDQRLGIRKIWEEHLSPSNLIRKVLIEAITHSVVAVIIEAIAYQFTLLHWCEYLCKEHHITGINFLPIYANQASKNSRISTGLKAMQTKEIYLHPEIRAMVQRQIADWNPMKRDNIDDILDCISSCPKVLSDYSWDIMSKVNFLVLEADGATVRDDNLPF